MSINIGVIGVGRFGRLHLRVLQQNPNVNIVAVADVNDELLTAVAHEFNVPRVYTSGDDLIADSNIDAIDVVCDEGIHGEYVVKALQHRKHVFVEKPLASNIHEAEAIQDLSKKTNCMVMVGNISRFVPPYSYIHRMINSGSLGKVAMIHAKRNFPADWFSSFGKRIHPVYESAVHDIDLLLWYAGCRCVSVFAQESYVSNLPYPDVLTCILTFENGLVASLDTSWMVPAGAPVSMAGALELGGVIDAQIEVIGTKKTARFDLANPGFSIWGDSSVQYPELWLWPYEGDGVGGAIRAELTHFVDSVMAGKESVVAPVRDSVEAIRICDAIVESAKHGLPVSIHEVTHHAN